MANPQFEAGPDTAIEAAEPGTAAREVQGPPDSDTKALLGALRPEPGADAVRGEQDSAELRDGPETKDTGVKIDDNRDDSPIEVSHDAGLGILWVGAPDGYISSEIEGRAAFIDEVAIDEEASGGTHDRLLRALGDEAVKHNLDEVVTSTHDVDELDAVARTFGGDAEHLSFFAYPPGDFSNGTEVELPMSLDQARASLMLEAERIRTMPPEELEDYVTDPLNLRSHLLGKSHQPETSVPDEKIEIPKQSGWQAPTERADIRFEVGGKMIEGGERVIPADVELVPLEPVGRVPSLEQTRLRPLELERYDPRAAPDQVKELLRELHERGSGYPIDSVMVDRYFFGASITEIEAHLIPKEEYAILKRTHAHELPWRGTNDVIWTPYDMARAIFERVDLDETDTFCDLGAGYGRLLLYGAVVSDAQFTGVELVGKRADVAMKAARKYDLTNVDLRTGNVNDYPLTADAYFMYRPFSWETLSAVATRLNQQAEERANSGDKPLTVICRGSALPNGEGWPDREHYVPVRNLSVFSPSMEGSPVIRIYESRC